MAGLRIINQLQVRELLPMGECIELIANAMAASSRGDAIQPLRWIMDLPGVDNACWGTMSCYLAAQESIGPECFGIKVASVFPENFNVGLQSHQGMVILFEREHGQPQALFHGGEITAIRTGAASAVATRVLSREDSHRLAILGYGEQAGIHLAAMTKVRDIDEVRVWGRSPERAKQFADKFSKQFNVNILVANTVEDAVKHADIVCTTTASLTPILQGEWIQPGTHLNVVGSSVSQFREVDVEAVVRSRFYVDFKPMTLVEGGEYLVAIKENAIDESHIVGEVGDVLLGNLVGRQNNTEITMYKSLGMPVQDLASALFMFNKAEKNDVGVVVDF